MILLGFNRTTLMDENRMRDTATVAVEENWPAIEQHLESIRCPYEKIIRSGIETRDFFDEDTAKTSDTIKRTFVITCHTQLIAQ